MGEAWRRRAEVWRARVRDAMRFEDPIPTPRIGPGETAHRAVVLLVIVAFTAAAVGLIAIPAVGIFGRAVAGVADRFEDEVNLGKLPKIAQRSVVYDRNGRVIGTLAGVENREYVTLDRVPEVAQQAVLAIEDANFFDHEGVHLGSLVRALVSNVRAGSARQGGSTITQQLIKNTLTGSERTLDRKVKEAKLAVALERKLSKKQILELYLNEAYFGEGVYGIGTAAEFYFGKDVSKLTLPQAALLAGIIRSPENYNPVDDRQAAIARRDLVLERMVAEGFATREQADAARTVKVRRKTHPLPAAKVPYFVELVKKQILDDERYGATRRKRVRALFNGGLQIHTTLDLRLQRHARRAVEGVLDLPDDPASALVSVDPTTGAVVAMVGGRDFESAKYNLAVQGKRQPGSTFKPFTLIAALEAGFPPGYTLDTPSPIDIVDSNGERYRVRNYDGEGRGPIDMRVATEFSVNTYFVQLIQKVGPEKVVDVAKRMGIASPLSAYLSLALGSIEVSPYELASAYGTMANGGVHCAPHAITRVTDPAGETLFEAEPACEEAIDAGIAATATDILYGVPLRGTGRANGRIGRPNAAKTGTTDKYTDAWYAGFTPQLSTVVWIGFPESTARPLKNIHGLRKVYGGSLPAMIWSSFMRNAHANLPVASLPTPPPPGQSDVPDVVWLSVNEARAALEQARFGVTVERVPSNRPEGTVVAQSPRGGGKAEAGSMVTIQVSNGEG